MIRRPTAVLRWGTENKHLEDFGIVSQAIRERFGVALSDETVSARDLNEGRPVCPLPVSVPAAHSDYVVYSESSRKRPEIRALIEWLLSTTGQSDQ